VLNAVRSGTSTEVGSSEIRPGYKKRHTFRFISGLVQAEDGVPVHLAYLDDVARARASPNRNIVYYYDFRYADRHSYKRYLNQLERLAIEEISNGCRTPEARTMGAYSFSGVPVFITIGATGTYNLDAFGGQGGSGQYGTAGGRGAEEGGLFGFTAGQVVEIVVGGAGGDAQAASYGGGGGGGGTFVFLKTGAGAYQTLLVAGGGGGGYRSVGGGGTVGAVGSGAGGLAGGYNFAGGGGAGVRSAGGTGGGRYGGTGGASRGGGFTGGAAVGGYYGRSAGVGGFGGGGGGGGYNGGGGGGGYTGGNGGYGAGGLGGTSFDAGTTIAAQTKPGVNSGNGSLTLNLVPCYVRGTLIQTNRGEVPVEILAIGDTVVTVSGARRPVRWIGRRAYARRFLAANPGAQPVRFRAGSLDPVLGGGLPRRDLLVSADHAMFLDGLLVPAGCLVNGTTITLDRGSDRIEYFHIELETHDVILAEGAPSETFVDDDSRNLFHNAAEFAALYPGETGPAWFCAPRVEHGPGLAAVRLRLSAADDRTAAAA